MGGKGKGKGKGWGKPAEESFDWYRDCRGCHFFGKPFKHDWNSCELNKKLLAMRHEADEAEPPQSDGRGRGKGKAKGKGKGADPVAEA